jgi:hypothetical protein
VYFALCPGVHWRVSNDDTRALGARNRHFIFHRGFIFILRAWDGQAKGLAREFREVLRTRKLIFANAMFWSVVYNKVIIHFLDIFCLWLAGASVFMYAFVQ